MTEIKEECQRDEKTISADDIEIPESFLKKRARDEKQQKIKKAKRENAIKKRAEKKDIIFKRAEAYVKEYLMEEADLKNLRKQASVNKDFFVEPEEKILFVFRIRGLLYFLNKKFNPID